MRSESPADLLPQLRERGHDLDHLLPLPGDVSRRRYLRGFRGSSEDRVPVIVAVYPRGLEPVCRRFLETGQLLAGVGVPVPEVLDVDCERGWMLLEDLGEATLYDRFSPLADPWPALLPYYRCAVGLIRRIAALPSAAVAGLNPPLDGLLLRRELDLTWELFFGPAGLTPTRGLGKRLAEILEVICQALAGEPPVPCHRDFMVRNLVPLLAPAASTGPEAAQLGVLDHQDLRLGPPFYDLASLLNDSLFAPTWVEQDLLMRDRIGERELLSYHRASVQRTLKAVGTFSRPAANHHRGLIRPTFERALDHLQTLPEASPLAPEISRLRRWAAGAIDLVD